MSRESKLQTMIEHRITIAVRYPLTAAVPSLAATARALVEAWPDGIDPEVSYDAQVEIVSQSAKTVRVPVANAVGSADELPIYHG